MICPECGGAELVADVRDQPYTYKGETTVVTHVKGDYCPLCNEGVLQMDEVRRVMEIQLAFNKEVNSSLVPTDFIVHVRKKLKLNQKEAGSIFGGGVNAFSKYETGNTKPPLALVQLFKVLNNHPELIEEIRAA